jgi:catalase
MFWQITPQHISTNIKIFLTFLEIEMNKPTLTTSTGAPVSNDNNSISVGARGPLTFDNHYLIEKLAHFNRERIPERVVHARGTGAYGTFTVTKSLKNFTIAEFLQNEGQQTEVFLRFSTVGGSNKVSRFYP